MLITIITTRNKEDGINIHTGDILAEELGQLVGQPFNGFIDGLGIDGFRFSTMSLHISCEWALSSATAIYPREWLYGLSARDSRAKWNEVPISEQVAAFKLRIEQINSMLSETVVSSVYLSSANLLYITFSNGFTLQVSHTDAKYIWEYELWRIKLLDPERATECIVVEYNNWYIGGQAMNWAEIVQRMLPKAQSFGFTRLQSINIRHSNYVYQYELLVANAQQQQLRIYVDAKQNQWSIKPYQQSAPPSQQFFNIAQIACDPDELVFDLLATNPDRVTIRLAKQHEQLVWAINGLGSTTLCVDATRPFTGLRG